MTEPAPTERGQDKKIKEMIDNINKLKADVKDIKEAFDDIIKGQKSIEELLQAIEKNV